MRNKGETLTRPKNLTWFLLGIMAIDLVMIINDAGAVIIQDYGVAETRYLVFYIAINTIEIIVYSLFFYKLKKKLLIAYFIFLGISCFYVLFTGGNVRVILTVGIFFMFREHWDKFR